MKTDKWYYQLLQTFPTLPFELIGLPIPDVPYEMQSLEVKEFGFRLDGLIIPVTPNPTYPVLLVEAQMQPDPEFYYRMHLELAVYLKQYQPPNDWAVVVIYPDRDTERTIPFLEGFLSFNQVYRVYLPELPTGVSFGLDLLRLVITPPELAPALGRQLIQQLRTFADTLNQQCLKLVTEMMSQKFPQQSQQEILRMLNLVPLEQTRAYQDAKDEGRQQGRQQGRQEGRQEGRREEGISLIIRQLQRKFGTLSPTQITQIQSLTLEQLETLGEDLLEFTTPLDLQNWLNQTNGVLPT